MDDIKKWMLNFLSLSELEYGSLEFGSKGVRSHLTICKWVVVIAIEIERTQIHFLSTIFMAVAIVVS